MITTYKSHGNQQPSLEEFFREGSTTIPGGGVEPSGSKREASVKADGEIVCSAPKDAEGRDNSESGRNIQGLGALLLTTQCIRRRCHRTRFNASAIPMHHRPSPRKLEVGRVLRAHGHKGERDLPSLFPAPITTVCLKSQPVRGFPQGLTHVSGCAQSAQRTHRENDYFSSHCTPRNRVRRCRGYNPSRNRRDQGRNSESPSTGQRPVDIFHQPCTSLGRYLTVLYRNNYKAMPQQLLVGGE